MFVPSTFKHLFDDLARAFAPSDFISLSITLRFSVIVLNPDRPSRPLLRLVVTLQNHHQTGYHTHVQGGTQNNRLTPVMLNYAGDERDGITEDAAAAYTL